MKSAGRGANSDRRISILRKADTAASNRYGIGGLEKTRQQMRPITLPHADVLAKIGAEEVEKK